MNLPLQSIARALYKKRRCLLAGVLVFLCVLRIGEFAIDVYLGNGDGYMTGRFPAFGMTILYATGFLLALLLIILTCKLDQKSPWVHIAIVIVLSFVVWMVFYPAIMSPDSIEQYRQALSRSFGDWHPPVMALILSGIMSLGGDIEHLMLLQCLLGGLGVYSFARCVVGFSKIPPRAVSCLAMAIFCILLFPITPLTTYLMIFWKDAWCAILLLWVFSIALTLFKYGQTFSSRKFYSRYAMFILSAAFTLLTRHNAVVMLPFLFVLSLVILAFARKRTVLFSLVLSLSIFLLYLGLLKGQYLVFQVEQQHAGQQVVALDLVGMIVHEPSLRREFPYTSQHLTDEYAREYKYGDIVPLYTSALTSSYSDRAEMLREYQYAILHFPFTWFYVKLRAFYELIRPTRVQYWFLMNISENPFGLTQNGLLSLLRNALRTRLLMMLNNPLLRFFSGIHLVWIVMNVFAIGWCGKRYYTLRKSEHLLWLCMFSLLFAYYSSYFLATTAWDFRFMYPATLSMQVMTLAYFLKTLYERSMNLPEIFPPAIGLFRGSDDHEGDKNAAGPELEKQTG